MLGGVILQGFKRKRDLALVAFLIFVLISIFYIKADNLALMIILSLISIAILLILINLNKKYYYAKLIYENQIFSVSKQNSISASKNENQAIVSGFGILYKNNVYKWNTDGIKGARLIRIHIGLETVKFTFGTNGKSFIIELLHEIENKDQMGKIVDKLWFETGIRAKQETI
jgi:hypothetical protein